MPDCIGIPANLVYNIQCIITIFTLIAMLVALLDRKFFPAQFRIVMFISALGLLMSMVLISKLAFAGIGNPGDLSQSNCNSAIFIGK
jgi:hypothetical protein